MTRKRPQTLNAKGPYLQNFLSQIRKMFVTFVLNIFRF